MGMGTSIKGGIMELLHIRTRTAACGCLLLAFLCAGCGRDLAKKQATIVDGVEVVANPATPLHKDPGRVLQVREKLRIRDIGEEFFFKGPHFPGIGPDGGELYPCSHPRLD